MRGSGETPGLFGLRRREATAVVGCITCDFQSIDATSAFAHAAASVCVHGSLLQLCPRVEATCTNADASRFYPPTLRTATLMQLQGLRALP